MEQKQFTDEDLILKLLEENNGSLSIEKLIPLFSRDERSPKSMYINDCVRNLKSSELIFIKDAQKVIWAITDEGTRRLHPENFTETETETETVKEEVPIMADGGDRNNHY